MRRLRNYKLNNDKRN